MHLTPSRYEASLEKGFTFPSESPAVCQQSGIDYPWLYQKHYGRYPDSWLTGIVQKVRTGYASDPQIRLAGASGGVLTRTLIYLLESGRIDGAIVARQGIPTPMEASATIATTPAEILASAGSVYIPVPMIPALAQLEAGKRYAFVGTPEQTSALRALQQSGDARAKQVLYVLGPYTGTALEPQALNYYLASNHVSPNDPVTSVKWRAGVWPGYLEIRTKGGTVLKSPKVYYNFLIPFFVTRTSLLSMDFCNEFARRPARENRGTQRMKDILSRKSVIAFILLALLGAFGPALLPRSPYEFAGAPFALLGDTHQISDMCRFRLHFPGAWSNLSSVPSLCYAAPVSPGGWYAASRSASLGRPLTAHVSPGRQSAVRPNARA